MYSVNRKMHQTSFFILRKVLNLLNHNSTATLLFFSIGTKVFECNICIKTIKICFVLFGYIKTK